MHRFELRHVGYFRLSEILVDFCYQRKEQDEAKGTNSVLSRVTDQEIYRRPCGGAIEASE